MKNDSRNTNQSRPVYDFTPTAVSIGIIFLNVALAVFQTKPIHLGLFALMIRIIIVIWISDLAEKRGKKSRWWVVFGLLFPLPTLFIIGFIPSKKRRESRAIEYAHIILQPDFDDSIADFFNNIKKELSKKDIDDYCLQIFKREIPSEAENAAAYRSFIMASHKYNLGDKNMALSYLNRTIDLFPIAESLILRGDIKVEKYDFVGAADDYSRSIQIGPNAIAYNNRGVIHSCNHELDKAMLDFNNAISLFPEYPAALSNRGALKYKLHDYKGAIEDLTATLNKEPYYRIALYFRGLSYAEIGEYKSARTDLSTLAKYEPTFLFAFYERGNIKLLQKEYNEAISDYSEALMINSKHTMSYVKRGIALVANNKIKQAIKDFSRAIEIEECAMAYLERGNAYKLLKKFDKAEKDFRMAKTIFAKNENEVLDGQLK